MKRCYTVAIVLIVSLQSVLQGQMMLDSSPLDQENKPAIVWDGYVCFKISGDSRQVVDFRNGLVPIYPEPKLIDIYGCDITDRPEAGMVETQTRLRNRVYVKDASWCKQLNTHLEADFTGVNEVTPQLFRLRQAYLKIEWENDQLVIGQTWNPMFVTDCFPDTISFSNGIPIETFSRNPMVRYKHNWGPMNLALTLYTEPFDFASFGPIGESTTYMRNAVMPDTNVQVRYEGDRGVVGAFFDTKRLVPRLMNSLGQQVRESIVSYVGSLYGSINVSNWRFASKVIYAQNPTDYAMIGGYGVSAISQNDWRCYTPSQSVSVWIDTFYRKDQFGAGGFIGVIKNLGTVDPLTRDAEGNLIMYGRGLDVDWVWRIAPRATYTLDALRLAAELEYTAAGWGTLQASGRPGNIVPVGSIRVLLAAFYFF